MLAPISLPECAAGSLFLQVIFDNLFGVVTNAKLKILSLHFVQHICSRFVWEGGREGGRRGEGGGRKGGRKEGGRGRKERERGRREKGGGKRGREEGEEGWALPSPLPTPTLQREVSYLFLCRASEQKLKVMAPVVLTGLNKIINQPPEVGT
jgi:hypothetical protein